MKQLTGILTILLLVVVCASAQAGTVLNGTFGTAGIPPDPFANWDTDTANFDRPSDGGAVALFSESGPVGSSQLAQTFVLPSGAQSLSFEYRLTSVAGGPTGSPVSDSFQATLFDSAFTELFPSNPPLFTAFFSVDNSNMQFTTPVFVSTQSIANGFERVTLDLSTLALESLTIDFLLNGAADGVSTQIELDNVSLATVPEPTSTLCLTTWGLFSLIFYRPNRGRILGRFMTV